MLQMCPPLVGNGVHRSGQVSRTNNDENSRRKANRNQQKILRLVLVYATDQGKRGAILVLSEYRRKHRQRDGHKRKATGCAACRKLLQIMVSRAGLEPATR